jgi:hypothetical protein
MRYRITAALREHEPVEYVFYVNLPDTHYSNDLTVSRKKADALKDVGEEVEQLLENYEVRKVEEVLED